MIKDEITKSTYIDGHPRVPFIINSPDIHTMGWSLFRYLRIKVHPYVDDYEYQGIIVVGRYDRSTGISIKEKRDKWSNWQRPTAFCAGTTLEIRCFPGVDYVFHYGSLIASYLALTGRASNVVRIEEPSYSECWRSIELLGLSRVRPADFVVLGAGLENMAGDEEWYDHGSFLGKRIRIRAAELVFLIVKHSFWGDIAGRLLTFLSSCGHKRFVFVGKLGGLRRKFIPNETIVTGNSSLIEGETVNWNGRFDDMDPSVASTGSHITMPSVMMETKEWLHTTAIGFDFVDPEIGHFARSAIREGVEFNYLHFVSDNLRETFSEDLSNERQYAIPERRKILYRQIGSLIYRNVLRQSRSKGDSGVAFSIT